MQQTPFAQTPMLLAYQAHDLAAMSGGRFVLGLGSQVRAHVERRFGMPWSHPAARMREFVEALRAIWASWQDGTPLDVRGAFYAHTLMPPFFVPAPLPCGPPPVLLAGVGTRMTEVAGQVADGFIVHPFTTRQYLEEVTIPALRRGRAVAARGDLGGFDLCGPVFAVTGRDEAEIAAAIGATKAQLAFYASTPAYRGVLELHDRAELGADLARLARTGAWEEMGELIDDELLHLVAVVGEPSALGEGLRARWGASHARLWLYLPHAAAPDAVTEVVRALRRMNVRLFNTP